MFVSSFTRRRLRDEEAAGLNLATPIQVRPLSYQQVNHGRSMQALSAHVRLTGHMCSLVGQLWG